MPQPAGWRCTRGYHEGGSCALVEINPQPAEDIEAAEMQAAIQEGIGQAVSQAERGILTKWVALVETLGPDGKRGIWALGAEGMLAWEALGMLEYGRMIEQGKQTALFMDGEEG
jgi:hypothetical protein